MSPLRKPRTFIIFGATGDLAVKKIFPALSHLYLEGVLEYYDRIIAVSRRAWNAQEFQTYLEESGTSIPNEFLKKIEYAEVEFEKRRDYSKLIDLIDTIEEQDIFCYLSLAPRFFTSVIEDLRDNQILKDGKLLLEKPFGTDARSAHELDDLLTSFLNPEQIHRVDHYLGKTTVQAIMRIHEASTELRKALSNETVDLINVCLFEEKGIEKRGASYDGVGALRDVGQNHMLEVLAVLMAEYPEHARADAWHSARALVLQNLSDRDASIRIGQYEGYAISEGVAVDSKTETAFSVQTTFKAGELKGVPVELRAGKKMIETTAYIEIIFKDIAPLPKQIRFEIQPIPRSITEEKDGTETIVIFPEERDAYANVLIDATRGESRHFVAAEEAFAAWKFTDALIKNFEHIPLKIYSGLKPF